MIVVGWMLGCGGPSGAGPQAVPDPEALGSAECAVCGMVVREQPAPRGQVVHRDGAHAHFCSLGDLRAYLQAPGPRGKPVATWVEGLEATYDPAVFDVDTRPWVAANEAHYVVGFERPRVMGRPALSFVEGEAAVAAAGRLGARVATWGDLVATPFSEDPP